jgi:hypothetical protein
MRREQ